MQQVVIINGYRFCKLDQLEQRKAQWLSQCEACALKGTVLLTPEGINIAMAGSREGIDRLIAWLETDALTAGMWLKETYAKVVPFTKVVIKIKSEIISMASPEIDPNEQTAPNISPQTLKQWFDEGKDMVLLDARNNYEYDFGTFDGAIHPDVAGFKQFKEGMESIAIDKKKTVVTFCTGGVRCEKSSAWMQQMGFDKVYQLEGGVLNYFQEVGGNHYHGECFVFDDRVALTTDLSESGTKQCECCASPVSIKDQAMPSYVPDVSCPQCIEG